MRRLRRTRLAVAALAAGLLTSCASAQNIAGDGASTHSRSGPSTPASPTAPPPGPTTPPASGGNLPAGFGKGPSGSGLDRFYNQQVSWTDCGGGDRCASIWVPLDYAHPNREAITIKAKMQPASDPAHKVGTLFINPGGPGESGIDYLSFINLDDTVTRSYDVVGFDPRGVGQSTPVHCVSNRFLDRYLAADPSPDTPGEVHTMERLWTQFTRGCEAGAGPLLAHVSTIEAARDMDILRAVVKDPTFNYYGASYGTYLGATYAALFPTKVHRMVLDGAVDPEATAHASEINQTKGFQRALTAYLTSCVGSGNCPLGNTVAGAQRRLIQLFSSLDSRPLPTTDGRPLTQGLAFFGVVLPLYSPTLWTYETQALQQALSGSGDLFLLLSDQYANRSPDGTYTSNAIQVQSAVSCLDQPQHESVAQIEAGKAAFLKASPVFGPVAMWFPYGCSNWPVKSPLPKPNYAAPGAPPIVVVGTTRDPATPYEQSVRLAKELDSGVLLSRNGDGHTAYSSGNVCIDQAVDNYLVTGTAPAKGTMC